MSKEKDKPNIADETYDEMTHFEDFFVSHWQKILYSAIALVILFTVYAIVSQISKNSSLKASSEFGIAKSADELKAVIEKYPNHPSANFAKLRLAGIYVNDKKLEDAMKIYKSISAEGINANESVCQAKINEAYVFELMGKKDESAELFSKIGADLGYPVSVRSQANYSAARIYNEKGNKDKAITCLNAIDFKTMKEDFWAGQAKDLLKKIN